MSTAFAVKPKPRTRGQLLRLSNVDWRTYSRLVLSFGNRHDVRLTYDEGELEIMVPLLEHDWDGRVIYLFVAVLTEELGLPLTPGGTTTMRQQLKKKGIEADEIFWIENAPRMAGRRRLDLRRDPAPDLAVEVDVTHSSLDRLSIYAAIGIPELWRLKGKTLTFYLLGADGTYAESAVSRAFPLLGPGDLLPFMREIWRTADVHPVLRKFRSWLRRRIKKKS